MDQQVVDVSSAIQTVLAVDGCTVVCAFVARRNARTHMSHELRINIVFQHDPENGSNFDILSKVESNLSRLLFQVESCYFVHRVVFPTWEGYVDKVTYDLEVRNYALFLEQLENYAFKISSSRFNDALEAQLLED